MKQLKREDLVEGEIYKCNTFLFGVFIMKAVGNLMECNSVNEERRSYSTQSTFGRSSDIQKNFIYELATPEEKHWLEVCIAVNSFISYEEAIKTFSPEFVLPKIWWVRITKENLKDISKFLDFNLGKYTIGFVVGMVKSGISGIVTKGYNSTPTTSYGSTFGNEITFEQFKKYVLKEDVEVLEEPKDKVLSSMRKEFKSIIYTVESSEGAIYQLGDKITVFTKNSPNKSKVFTIKGFRWNNAKTNICAITELHGKYGIGLDKIELYSEPVKITNLEALSSMIIDLPKELSLLEQAKLKYPIGTEFKAARGNRNLYTVKSNDIFKENSDNAICIRENGNGTVYFNGEWAEIIEDFKLPETWWITIENERQLEIAKQYFSQFMNHMATFNTTTKNTIGIVKTDYFDKTYLFNLSHNTKSRNPQITFEQFEQYVLHNGFKVGDKFTKQKYCEVTEKEIIALEYIGNCSIAVYKYTSSNHTSPQCRILTKNIVR